MFETNFSSLDWGIVAVYLAVVAIVGMLVNRYIHNVDDYLVGGRGSGTALNTATFIGTGLGLVTIMYAAMDGFQHGFSYMTLGLIGMVVGVGLGLSGFVITRLREAKLLTIPEFFHTRYSPRVRIVAGSICALAGILNMGLFPKMGATFLTYATGLGQGDAAAASQETTINIVTSILIVLVLAYTVLGGMVSVIVTDYLQFVILSTGLGFGLYFCLTNPELGWDRMVGALEEHRGERAFNPVHKDSYGGIWVIWMTVHFAVAALCWAPEVSRALTAKDPTATKRTFLFGAPGQFIRLAIPALLAIAAFCYISQHVELGKYFFPEGLSGKAAHPDQAMPLVLGKIVPTGLLGILVAGLMAAFMSTHDSYFLCWSSVIARDVVAPMKKRELSDREQIRITRIAIVCIGIFLLVWGIWYELPDSVWGYMAVTGNIYMCGAIVGLVGGMYWKGASSAGAMAALLGGLLSVTLIFLPKEWQARTDVNAALSLGNYAVCVALFVVFSLLFPDKRRTEEGA